jgi:hypothetical protein
LEVVRYLGVPCDRQVLYPQACPAVTRYPVHIAPGADVYIAVVLRVVGKCIDNQPDGSATNDLLSLGPITMRFHFVGGTRTVTLPADDMTALQFAGRCNGDAPVAINPPSQ